MSEEAKIAVDIALLAADDARVNGYHAPEYIEALTRSVRHRLRELRDLVDYLRLRKVQGTRQDRYYNLPPSTNEASGAAEVALVEALRKFESLAEHCEGLDSRSHLSHAIATEAARRKDGEL